MPSPGTNRRDFFISFNSADRDWAEWIASELEAAGYTTYFQNWDFAPGSNFVLEMQKAASQSDRTIAVLSPAYLSALFTQPEWAAALVQDPTGSKRTLVPVRVQECRPGGILAPIVYSDLVGLNEEAARAKVRAAVQGGGRPTPGSVAFPKPAKGAAGRRAFPPTAPLSPATEPSSPAASSPPSAAAPASTAATKPVLDKPQQARESSFVWFRLALLVAGLLIGFADRLSEFRLVNQLYYLVLVAVSLAAAVSLFGTLHSRARYRGESQWGVLELGGPVVVFALVMAAGMWFAPSSRSFGVTVHVRGEDGGLPLRGQGRVMLQLGADPRSVAIGENGAAFFLGIPAEFRGRPVPLTLDAEGFERTESRPVKLAEDSVSITVRKRAGRLYGVVVNASGRPVAGATVDAGGVLSVTGPDGRFDLAVTERVLVRVVAKGFGAYAEYAMPGANEMTVPLVAEER